MTQQLNAASPVRPLLRVAVVAACLVAMTGCTTVRGWFSSDKEDLSKPAALTEITSTASVARAWSANVGKGEARIGSVQSPAIEAGRVYAAAVNGGVRALDLQTGSAVWSSPSSLRLAGSPGVGDGLVAVGSLEGIVLVLDAATGAQRWQTQLRSEIIARPAIGQGLVVVRGVDGQVTAFDANSGERRWSWNADMPALTVRGNAGVVMAPGFVFIANDDGSLMALSASDGRPLWEQFVAQPDGRTELERMVDVDGTPVLDGINVYASSYKYATVAIEGPSGRPLWQAQTGGAGKIGVGTSQLVVADRDGTVWAIDKASGGSLWRQAALARRNLSGVAVQGEYAVVGDLDGYLHWMRLSDGAFAARTRVARDAVRAAPVVADGLLVVQTTGGNVSAYRLQ